MIFRKVLWYEFCRAFQCLYCQSREKDLWYMCGMWHSPEEILSAVYSQSKYLFCLWKCTIGVLHNFNYGRWPDLYAVSFIVDL